MQGDEPTEIPRREADRVAAELQAAVVTEAAVAAAERAAAQRPAEPYKPGVPIDGFGWDTVSADPKGHNVFMDNLAAWLVSSAAASIREMPGAR